MQPATGPKPRNHPGACGERVLLAVPPMGSVGPSPRVQGAQPIELGESKRVGTIPAGAGSALGELRFSWMKGVVFGTPRDSRVKRRPVRPPMAECGGARGGSWV